MTVMEVRRAQGFPDNEVIVGTPAMQWKIVGNSVARPVALALGLALRQAWLSNGEDVERTAAACQETAKIGETLDSDQENEVDGRQEHTAAEPPIADTDAEATESPVSETAEQATPRKGLTGHPDTPGATPRTKASKARVLRPAAPPAKTFTKRLRSTLSTETFVQLPKKRRQPQQPLAAHSNFDSAIEISSDDDSPSQTGTKGTTTPEGEGKDRGKGGLLGSSPVGKLLKMGQDLAKSLI